MARVFVSYRRADGVYGVGWIVERLDRMTGGDVHLAAGAGLAAVVGRDRNRLTHEHHRQ